MLRALGLLPLACLLITGCSPSRADPWGEPALARLSLRDRAAQLLVVPVDSSADRRVRTLAVGGVELRGGSMAALPARLGELRRRAYRPLLVVADLGRGVGGTITGAAELPEAGALPPSDADHAARVAALEAGRLGVNLGRVRGPAASPQVGADTTAVERYAAGLASRGVAPVVTVLGADSARLDWDRAALDAGPLRALRRMMPGAGGVELGWTVIPALSGDSTPLALSPAGASGLVRRDLGFLGVVAADLSSGGPWRRRFGANAPVRAVAAGADLLLGMESPGAAIDSILAAVDDGRLPRARVDDAVRRVFALKRRLGLGMPPEAESAADSLLPGEAARLADQLRARALLAAGDPAAALARCRAPAVVAGRTARISDLIAGLRRVRPGIAFIRLDSVATGRLGSSARDCLVVVSVEGAGPAVSPLAPPADSSGQPARAVLRVALGGAPPAGGGPWLLAPGSGPASQRLAADALLGRASPTRAALTRAPALVRAPADSVGMSRDSLAAIDQVIRAALDQGVFTAAAVAVGRRGRLVKLAGYGTTSGHPVSADSTLFDLASLTKVVGTTSAAMVMVDDGAMQVGAPLHQYVSGFRLGGRGDVTLRHLLTHTAGLPAGDDLYHLARSPDAALRRVNRVELLRDPGEAVRYSDFSMILLAEAIQARSGEPLDQLLARRVFGPLGMVHTRYRPSVLLQDYVVPTALRSERPYVLDGVVHDGNAFRLGGVAGHAGLFSTAHDLAVLSQTILNAGAYGETRVWSPGVVHAFTRPQGLPGGRALGWDVPGPNSSAGDYYSPRSIGHTGYTGTSIWIDLDRELFVVLLTNRTYDRGTQEQIYRIRRRVDELAARAITDRAIAPRPGTPAARAAAARAAAERARLRRHPPRRHTPARRPTPRRRRG